MKPIREFTKPPTRDTISPKSGTPKQITNTRPTSVVCEAANGHSSEQVQQRTHRHATHPNDVASGLHPVLHAKNNGLLYYLTCGRKNLQHSTQVENHVCTRRAKARWRWRWRTYHGEAEHEVNTQQHLHDVQENVGGQILHDCHTHSTTHEATANSVRHTTATQLGTAHSASPLGSVSAPNSMKHMAPNRPLMICITLVRTQHDRADRGSCTHRDEEVRAMGHGLEAFLV